MEAIQCKADILVLNELHEILCDSLTLDGKEFLLYSTWEIIGPVSTPTAVDRNSWDCGSALPFRPIATPVIFAKPGMVDKLSVGGDLT